MRLFLVVCLAFLLQISSIKTATTKKTTTKKNCNYGTVLDGNTCRDCGLTNQNFQNNVKIVNGVEAVPHSWPAQALVKLDIGDGTSQCGGTLISRRTILTAAHCVFDDNGKLLKPASITVVLGLHVYPSDGSDFDSDAAVMRVAKVISHPNYNSQNYYNDIALLILSNHAQLNDYVKLACLPSNQSSIYPTPRNNAWIVGWGKTGENLDTSENLMNAKVPILTAAVCKKVYSDLLTKSQVCAGGNGKDTCQGDSGGPLYVLENIGGKLKYVVSGVVSNGAGCGENPGIYTRVSYFYDWIKANQM